MKLSIGLLTGLEHQTLGAFLLHSDCEVKTYSKVESFLPEALIEKFDLLFIGDRFLKTEDDYKSLRESILNLTPSPKVIFVSDNAPVFKLPNLGIVSSEDYNAVKEILGVFKKSKAPQPPPPPVFPKPQASFVSKNEIEDAEVEEEVVEFLEEEVVDVNFEKMTKAFLSLKKTQSIDEVGVALSNSLGEVVEPGRKGVFFKYLSTYCSLVALSGFNFKSQKINGIGLNFSGSKEFSAGTHLSKLKLVPAFQKVVGRVFGHENVEVKTLDVDGDVKGVLVYEAPALGSFDMNLLSLCDYAEARLSAIVYKHKYIQNKVNDELTNCVLREGFFEQLQNEIIRSKRVHLPVSVMLFEIDGFYGVKTRYNEERVKTLLKSFAAVLRENIRHNDLVGRVGEAKFAVLFPHMSTENALLKAQKFSKLIAQTKFFSDMKTKLICSTSITLGTYPTQSSSADDLMTSLESTMTHREAAGTTTVIHVKPGFVKDFEEQKLPVSGVNEKKVNS